MADARNTPVLPETKAPRDRARKAFFDLESPIRNAANASKVLEILLQDLAKTEPHQLPGHKSIVVDDDTWDAFVYALYHVGDTARKSAEAFDLACENLKDPAPAGVAEGESRTP